MLQNIYPRLTLPRLLLLALLIELILTGNVTGILWPADLYAIWVRDHTRF